MFDEHADRIRADAVAAYPNEAVFLLSADGDCRRVNNCADDPTSTFRVSKREMARGRAAGLAAVVHSHPDYPACPSAADMRGQLSTAVPWGVVATDGQSATSITWWGEGVPVPELVGRPFVHGVTDCYSAIRDWFRSERDTVLPEFPRDWEWWNNEGDLYRDGFAAAGFTRIDTKDALPGDVWLCQLRSPVPNHGGVLLERGLCLHHPSARLPVEPAFLSRIEPINRWLPHITHVLRYTG